MRILLSTYGSRGDVEPLVGLAVALQSLGAGAVVSAPPEPEFEELLARAGVESAPAFMSVRQWIDEARRDPKPIPALAARMVPAQYDSLYAASEGCDAIVATGLFPSAAAARNVADKRGLRYEQAVFCPISLPSHHHKPFPRPGRPLPPEVTDTRALWDLNLEVMNDLFGEATNAARAAVGLPVLDNVRDHVFTDRPLLAVDPVLWPWEPTDLSETIQTGAWILPDTRPLPADLEAFLEAGPAPVYVGFGSIALPSTREAARIAIEAARADSRRVVLAQGWVEAEPLDDGDDVFLTGDVNQQSLFPRMAAVVHHGGAGTTTTAARAGAPQVIVPQIVDQPFWAARVAGLGVGVAHDGATPTLESLSAALATALSPEVGARAAAIAPTIRADGAMIAARMLLDEL
ncbi:glycosyltransferase [Brevundimonas sp.]|uniref:glycosyltransferase n=1 Tax=Brevundimonas sp. TaxID=1871086 RepID=UPI002FCC5B54